MCVYSNGNGDGNGNSSGDALVSSYSSLTLSVTAREPECRERRETYRTCGEVGDRIIKKGARARALEALYRSRESGSGKCEVATTDWRVGPGEIERDRERARAGAHPSVTRRVTPRLVYRTCVSLYFFCGKGTA